MLHRETGNNHGRCRKMYTGGNGTEGIHNKNIPRNDKRYGNARGIRI